MADDSAQDKELPASARRQQQAREKGQVSRSRDLTSSLLLLGGAVALVWGGSWAWGEISTMLRDALTIPVEALRDPLQTLAFAGHLGLYAVILIVPFLLLAFVASIGGGVALGGWVFSFEVLMPDFSRVDPVAGLGRLFSTHGLGELGKALLKAVVMGSIVALILWSKRGPLLQSLLVDPTTAPVMVARICADAFLLLAAATLLVAAVDVPWQIYQFNDKLKMSHQDMKDEARESEGNPEVKGRLRSLQRERARRRMMAAVPQADVVVTNPTHYAVALAYKQGVDRAPRVLALGADAMAARIRELAAEHHIPVVEAPPLARALYRYADLDREIPAALYNAVALLLAYVYQLSVLPARAAMPADWAIPSEIDTSADTPMPLH